MFMRQETPSVISERSEVSQAEPPAQRRQVGPMGYTRARRFIWEAIKLGQTGLTGAPRSAPIGQRSSLIVSPLGNCPSLNRGGLFSFVAGRRSCLDVNETPFREHEAEVMLTNDPLFPPFGAALLSRQHRLECL